jgi:hypothetical protein
LQAASLASIVPPLNAEVNGTLACKDPAHIQFCADISQGDSQFIHPWRIDAILGLVFNYYDLPKILKPEYCGNFGRTITGNSPTVVVKSELIELLCKKFAGKCRARSLWNLLLTNGSALTPSDLIPVLDSVVASFGDLADLRGSGHEQRRKRVNYYGVILASLFAALGKRRVNHISWREFNKSNLADQIYALAKCTSSDDTNIFSRARVNPCLMEFDIFCGSFTRLDAAQILSYSRKNLLKCQQCSIAVLERLLEDPLFGLHGEMHAAGFVWFNLIVQDQGMTPFSVKKWFEILDINGDGYLDKQDLRHFFDGKSAQVYIFFVVSLPSTSPVIYHTCFVRTAAAVQWCFASPASLWASVGAVPGHRP